MNRLKKLIKRIAVNVVFTEKEKNIVKSALKYSELGYQKSGRGSKANEVLFLREYLESIF